jgi:hypothetical protein
MDVVQDKKVSRGVTEAVPRRRLFRNQFAPALDHMFE